METKSIKLSQFTAVGEIIFSLDSSFFFPSRESLIAALHVADDKHPWVARNDQGEIGHSMVNIAFDENCEASMSIRRVISFMPSFYLKPSQFNAYERYLDKLAFELSQMGLDSVFSVHGRLVLSKCTTCWGSKKRQVA